MNKVTTARQGYVTMAYGKRRFFEMAVNFSLSVRLHDPKRPTTLVFKKSASPPPDVARHFDSVQTFENEERYPGVTIKLALYEPTPYEEAFYIDADCLLMKPDMDRHWMKFAASDFNVAGEARKEGAAARRMMAASRAPYFVDANFGVFYFRKNAVGRAVFDHARALLDERDPGLIENRPVRRGDGLSDQPYFGAAMALQNIDPISYRPEEGTIMATTYRASAIDFDLEKGRASLSKPAGFFVANRFWARSWVRHDTTVGHFIELRPRAVYQRLSDWLRDRFDVPRYQFD